MWLLAALIAAALALAEILSRHPGSPFHRVFLINPYNLFLFALDGAIAGVLYLYVPDIAKLLNADRLAEFFDEATVVRALTIGFGFPMIIKSRFATARFGTFEFPAGFEALYNAYTRHFVRRANQLIARNERKVFTEVWATFKSPDLYRSACMLLIEQEPTEKEKSSIRDRISRIEFERQSDVHYGSAHVCQSYFLILYRQLNGKKQEVFNVLEMAKTAASTQDDP